MFYQLKFFDPSASDAKISTQAGIIVGAKTAAQVCTGMLWGRLADSEWGGRKVVLMIGLLSSGKTLSPTTETHLTIDRPFLCWIWIFHHLLVRNFMADFRRCYE